VGAEGPDDFGVFILAHKIPRLNPAQTT